jgi:phosphate starvation-inducible protein PhoH and related proteins
MTRSDAPRTLHVEFSSNPLAQQLFGEQHRHLHFLEKELGVTIYARGNHVAIEGESAATTSAEKTLQRLYKRLEKGSTIEDADVRDALAYAEEQRFIAVNPVASAPATPPAASGTALQAGKRLVQPRTAQQAVYLKALGQYDLIFGLGPAGTGKTYLAVAKAVESLLSGQVQRLVLARPAVEAGERLGFLPGDMKEKIDPYLRPLYDALNELLPAGQVPKKIESGEIEIAPLAFMRGRTLSHAFVLVDEAQNTTPMQMKMLLTRLGEGSKMVVTGDLTQIDLPTGHPSGLGQALGILKNIPEIGVVEFTDKDVVRHPLVMKIVKAYQQGEGRHPSIA